MTAQRAKLAGGLYSPLGNWIPPPDWGRKVRAAMGEAWPELFGDIKNLGDTSRLKPDVARALNLMQQSNEFFP